MKTTPKKVKELSPAALARRLATRQAQERVAVLRELRHFGRALCSVCSHPREDHENRDGREVCTACWDSRLEVHRFRSLHGDAQRYFQDRRDVELAGGIDTTESGVLYYGDQPNHARGEGTMAVSTKRRKAAAAAESPAPARTRRPAPPRVAPPAPPARTAARPASQTAPVADLNECLCGCGQGTKSRFRPGHDATLKSRLTNQALEGATAKERAAAERQMEKLGWGDLLEKSRASREARAEKAAARPARASGRTAAQKAATERMRAASGGKRKATPADEVEDEEFDDEVEDDEELEEDEAEDEEEDDE